MIQQRWACDLSEDFDFLFSRVDWTEVHFYCCEIAPIQILCLAVNYNFDKFQHADYYCVGQRGLSCLAQ